MRSGGLGMGSGGTGMGPGGMGMGSGGMGMGPGGMGMVCMTVVAYGVGGFGGALGATSF